MNAEMMYDECVCHWPQGDIQMHPEGEHCKAAGLSTNLQHSLLVLLAKLRKGIRFFREALRGKEKRLLLRVKRGKRKKL
jgi:hypothetical protein